MGWTLPFSVGDTAPWFVCASPANPNFNFSTLGGRHVIFSLLGDPKNAPGSNVLNFMHNNRAKLNDEVVYFAAITQPTGVATAPETYQALRFFHDFDQKVATQYKAVDAECYHPYTIVLDPMMRVLAVIRIDSDATGHNQQLAQIMAQLPKLDQPGHAPILIIPRIFEPDFCRRLIQLYEENGGTPSGYMREVEGKTLAVMNSNFKRRKDFHFDKDPAHEALRRACNQRLVRRLLPQMHKAFQFQATRIERYVVAHYSHEDQGFFNPHRDNTTPGTAHRRFACTINLNAEEFTGGELRFPEFGRQTYRAPTGGAVIFSCSMMHEATPVTHGERYAFLPFFYNEETVETRAAGRKTLAQSNNEPIV